MKMCPRCRGKYADDFSVCSECNTTLTEYTPPSESKGAKKRESIAKFKASLHVNKNRSPTTYFTEKEQSIDQGITYKNKPTPKCPTCQSTNVHKIGAFDRLTSVGFWGLASSKLGKTMACDDCGYKW